MTKRQAGISAAFVFFFGLPLGGLVWVYARANSTIRESAAPFALEATQAILGEDDFESLYDLGTLTLKMTVTEADFKSSREKWGALESVGEFEASRPWMVDRSDTRWQFVALNADLRFENGPAKLRFVAARRSTRLEDWRIEEFEVSAPDVE